MIAVYIDSRITSFRNEIKYSFDFIFKTLGYEIKHISHSRELDRNDIVFYYSDVYPTEAEMYNFGRDKILFYIPMEAILYDVNNTNLSLFRSIKREINLSVKIPIFSKNELKLPAKIFRDKTYFCVNFYFDIIGNIFFNLSDVEGFKSCDKDSLGRAPDDCYTFREYMDIPYLNMLVWLIEQLIDDSMKKKPGFFLLKKEYWPKAEPFAFALTHNIDSVQKWSFSTLLKSSFSDLLLFYYPRYVWKNTISRIRYLTTNLEEYWSFDKIREIIQKHKISSTCFVGTEKADNEDVDYTLADIDVLNEVKELQRSGVEVALLASVRSIHDDVLDKQRKQISIATKQEEIGVRQNNYCYNHELSAEFQNKAGVFYDSTHVLLDKPGFKNGIGFPYYSYPIYRHSDDNTLPSFIRGKILEFPVQFDDDHLIDSPLKKQGLEKAKASIDSLFDNIEPCNGIIVSEFSHSNFVEIDYELDLINYTIESVKKRSGYIDSLRNLAKWWKTRESVIINESQRGIFIYFPKRLEHFTVKLLGTYLVNEIAGIKAELKGNQIYFSDIKPDTTVEIKLVKDRSSEIDSAPEKEF